MTALASAVSAAHACSFVYLARLCRSGPNDYAHHVFETPGFPLYCCRKFYSQCYSQCYSALQSCSFEGYTQRVGVLAQADQQQVSPLRGQGVPDGNVSDIYLSAFLDSAPFSQPSPTLHLPLRAVLVLPAW